MAITLGWVALLLAGATGAAPVEENAVPISYTVRMVEADGVQWRASVISHLKPVSRQGSATVWALPKGASKSLILAISRDASGAAAPGSRVTALSGAPATIESCENRTFITQAVWNKLQSTPQGSSENVRAGWRITIVGRKLDQGILVRLVFEDTQIRGVHRVRLADPGDLKRTKSWQSDSFPVDDEATGATPHAFDKSAFQASESAKSDTEGTASNDEGNPDKPEPDAARKSEFKDLMDKATTAYTEGKYFRCETLAKRAIEVDQNELAAAILVYKAKTQRRFGGQLNDDWVPICGGTSADDRVDFELPEIVSQEIHGEWLVPKGECLLLSFGPHTAMDMKGNVVVREPLAFVEADEQPEAEGVSRPVRAGRTNIMTAPTDDLLSASERLRQAGDEWRTFWLLDQPSHMTPYRIHGHEPDDDPRVPDSDQAQPSRRTKKPRKPEPQDEQR
jgi:hypothetical protein